MQGSVSIVKTVKTKMRDEYRSYDRDRKRDKDYKDYKKFRRFDRKRKAYYEDI